MEAQRIGRVERAPYVKLRTWLALGLCQCALALVAGCGALPLAVDVPPEPVVASPDAAIAVPPAEVPAAGNARPTASGTAPVLLLVSSRLPAYFDVAEQLVELIGGDDSIVAVLDDEREADDIRARLSGAPPRAAVAIGLPAALYAASALDAPLVFCQVFNYRSHEPLARAAAGVAVLPSFDDQLGFWKQLDGKLDRIGAIVGPGHEDLLASLASAGAGVGVSVDARVSNSDQETIYIFKRLAASIDGFMLFPDNRILSVGVIDEILAYAQEHRVEVVVSNPELLERGALMSFASSPEQIADAVYGLVQGLDDKGPTEFRLVTPSGFEVGINPLIANAFGIDVPSGATHLVSSE